MIHTITIDRDYLAALVPFIPKQDIRLHPLGVAFQKDYIVASNGYTLGAFKVAGLLPDGCPDFIVPSYAVVSVLKAGGKACKSIVVQFDDERKTVTCMAGLSSNIAEAVDGVFPDWGSLIPQRDKITTTGPRANFDVELLQHFSKANKALGARFPGQILIEETGKDSVGLVSLRDPSFIGAIMPLRSDR